MRYISLLFIIIFHFACSNKQIDQQLRVYNADLDDQQTISIHDLFSKLEIIPLETSNQSLIQSIDKIIEYNSILYILDSRQKALLVFENNGKFITKINTVGRAPNEFYLLDDFTINTYSNTLECLDPTGKILCYDLLGTYISSIYLPHPPMSYRYLHILNKDSILLYTSPTPNSDFTFRIYSREKDSIVSQFARQKRIMNGGCMSPIVQYNNKLYFTQSLYNDIHYIMNDTLLTAYRWNFGDYTYDIKKIKIPDLTDPREQMKFSTETMYSQKIPYMIGFNSQNEQFLFSSLFMKNKIVSIFYNKKSKDKFIFSETKEGISIYPFYFDNEKIIGIAYESLTPVSSFKKASSVKIINKELLTTLTDDSNPVLIKYIFK